MANNRLWLHHKASGQRFYLCKRMGWGWYKDASDAEFGERFAAFLTACEEHFGEGEEGASQDSFELEIEDNERAPELKRSS